MRIQIFNFHPSTEQSVSLKQRLIKGAMGTFSLKIASTLLTFLLSLLLAKVVGSEGLGTYALVISYLGFLSLPAKLGFPQLLIRDVAIYSTNLEWNLLAGILRRSYQIVTVLSLVIAVIALAMGWTFFRDWPILLALSVALLSLPLSSLRVLNQSTMSGLRKVVQGQLPESLAFPLITLLLVAATYITVHNNITPAIVICCYVLSSMFTAGIGLYQLHCVLPKGIFSKKPIYRTQKWIHAAIPFMAYGGLSLINSQTDIIMLGAIEGPSSVGLYVVANRLASLVVFILLASNSVLGPNIASLYSSNELDKLQAIILKSSQIVLFASVLASVGLVIFRNNILGLFGQEFLDADMILIVLIVGQLVNAFVGPVGLLLNMSGNEKLSLVSFVLSAALNVSFNAYLIPLHGAQGAATATAFSTVVWNLLATYFVFKRLKLNPTALPLKSLFV